MDRQNCHSIQAYLYEQIPLSRAMEVRVVEVSNELVILAAPLLANINHHSTVFGGSASAVAILSAWTLINFRLKNEAIDSRLVIQKNTVSYDRPIVGDFEAVCSLNEPEKWERFTKILRRKQKSRITLNSSIQYQAEQVVKFEGVFVALGL